MTHLQKEEYKISIKCKELLQGPYTLIKLLLSKFHMASVANIERPCQLRGQGNVNTENRSTDQI